MLIVMSFRFVKVIVLTVVIVLLLSFVIVTIKEKQLQQVSYDTIIQQIITTNYYNDNSTRLRHKRFSTSRSLSSPIVGSDIISALSKQEEEKVAYATTREVSKRSMIRGRKRRNLWYTLLKEEGTSSSNDDNENDAEHLAFCNDCIWNNNDKVTCGQIRDALMTLEGHTSKEAANMLMTPDHDRGIIKCDVLFHDYDDNDNDEEEKEEKEANNDKDTTEIPKDEEDVKNENNQETKKQQQEVNTNQEEPQKQEETTTAATTATVEEEALTQKEKETSTKQEKEEEEGETKTTDDKEVEKSLENNELKQYQDIFCYDCKWKDTKITCGARMNYVKHKYTKNNNELEAIKFTIKQQKEHNNNKKEQKEEQQHLCIKEGMEIPKKFCHFCTWHGRITCDLRVAYMMEKHNNVSRYDAEQYLLTNEHKCILNDDDKDNQ